MKKHKIIMIPSLQPIFELRDGAELEKKEPVESPLKND